MVIWLIFFSLHFFYCTIVDVIKMRYQHNGYSKTTLHYFKEETSAVRFFAVLQIERSERKRSKCSNLKYLLLPFFALFSRNVCPIIENVVFFT